MVKKKYSSLDVELFWDSLHDFFMAERMTMRKVQTFEKYGRMSFNHFDDIVVLLHNARTKSHQIFRERSEKLVNPNDPGRLYDFIISTIYHEMLHIKEYVYIINTYGRHYGSLELTEDSFEGTTADVEHWTNKYTQDIFRAAERNLSKCMSNTWQLFENCNAALKYLLPKFVETVLPRIVYCNARNKGRVYQGVGFADKIFNLMFKDGACEGYYTAGSMLWHSGFLSEAGLAFNSSIVEYKKNPSESAVPMLRKMVDLCSKATEKNKNTEKTIQVLSSLLSVGT